jgi:hypothetical protein
MPPTTTMCWQQRSEVCCCRREPLEVFIGTLEFPFKHVEYLVESLPATLHATSLRADDLTLLQDLL